MNFPKYGKIENLSKKTEVLDHRVVVTEKIHGTNARVMWSPENGGLVLGSRNNVIYKNGESNDYDGYKFGNFMENHPCLEVFHNTGEFDDYVFYGEFHGSNIQKGVKYCEEKGFRVFDIRNPDGKFLDWDDVAAICLRIGFKTVPVLFRGTASLEDLDNLMNKNSIVAKDNGVDLEENIAEGIVIKPEKMGFDKRGEWLRAKYKSRKWSENAKAPKPKQVNPDMIELKNRALEFASQVVTPGRVSNIVEHITREGNTELDITRTGEFLRELVKDVMEEHKEVYEKLDKKEVNTYNKEISGQAVPLWKGHLNIL